MVHLIEILLNRLVASNKIQNGNANKIADYVGRVKIMIIVSTNYLRRDFVWQVKESRKKHTKLQIVSRFNIRNNKKFN